MADLHAPIDQLDTAGKLLRQRWEQTKPLWNDPVSQSFEQQYWATIEAQTRATLTEMQKVAQVIAEAWRRIH